VMLFAPCLCSVEEYGSLLKEAGFTDVVAEDRTWQVLLLPCWYSCVTVRATILHVPLEQVSADWLQQAIATPPRLSMQQEPSRSSRRACRRCTIRHVDTPGASLGILLCFIC